MYSTRAIEELARFHIQEVSNKRAFGYSVKQMVAREIETEKLRRLDRHGLFQGETVAFSEDMHSENTATTEETQAMILTRPKQAKNVIFFIILILSIASLFALSPPFPLQIIIFAGSETAHYCQRLFRAPYSDFGRN